MTPMDTLFGLDRFLQTQGDEMVRRERVALPELESNRFTVCPATPTV